LTLTLKAAKRTQNAAAEVVKDNGIFVGLNPQAGSPEGWHLHDNGGFWNMASTRSGCQCIERAGDP